MDKIISYLIAEGQARAFVAETTQTCRKAMQTHHLSHVATAALGRTLTCAAMIGIQMKNEQDSLTVTIKGDGPLGGITVSAKNNGDVKGYVDYPNTELVLRADGKLDVGGAVGKIGRLTVIKDLGMKEPYVGNVELQSGEIADDFAYYFAVSEQQPSAVALGVLTGNGTVKSAGGVIIQPLPGCSEEILRFFENSVPLLTDISAHFVGNTAKDVGELLFAPVQHVVQKVYPVRFFCDCSRKRLKRLLSSMGEEEINDMIEKQNGAEVTCHFCNKIYRFSAEELKTLKNKKC